MSLSADSQYIDFELVLQIRATVKSNGLVCWEPNVVFKTVCEMDISYFPFDVQICRLVFGTSAYPISMMNLSLFANEVNMCLFTH